MYGYRRLFVIGLAVFTVASLICGLAPNATALIVARVIQGTGAGLMVPQVLTGIQLNFAGAARSRATGFYSIALSIGAVAGQILGGILVSADLLGSSWRPIFLINLPIGVVVVAAAFRFLPLHRGGTPQYLDLWGVATLSAAVLLVVLPLVLGHTQHWPVWTWVSLLASAIPLAAFVVIERHISRRNGHPLINMQIVAQPAIAWALASYGAVLMTYFALLFTFALYLQDGLGRSAQYSGFALVSWVAAFGIGGPIVPHISPRFMRFVAPFGYLLRRPQPSHRFLESYF
jgi:MFS family permease